MSAFDADQALIRLDRIQKLLDQFTKAHGDMIEQQDVAERLHRELTIARAALEPFIKTKLPV